MYDKNSEDTAIRFIVVNGSNVVFNIILVILRRSNSKYTPLLSLSNQEHWGMLNIKYFRVCLIEKLRIPHVGICTIYEARLSKYTRAVMSR